MYPYFHSLEDTQRRTVRATLVLTIKTQVVDFRRVSKVPWRFLRPQLERAMPKRRLDEARVLAAVAANDPPASADHLDDDVPHDNMRRMVIDSPPRRSAPRGSSSP